MNFHPRRPLRVSTVAAMVAALLATTLLLAHISGQQKNPSTKKAEKGEKRSGRIFTGKITLRSSRQSQDTAAAGFKGVDDLGRVMAAALKSQPGSKDYDKVDHLAANKASPEDLRIFLREGRLRDRDLASMGAGWPRHRRGWPAVFLCKYPVAFAPLPSLSLPEASWTAVQFGKIKKIKKKAKKVADSQKPWTAGEEKAIGRAGAAKLVAVFGLYEEPKAVKYVNLVGAALTPYASRQDLDYRFGILDTEIFMAFAAPDGYVFVTRGLLANVESEAELAGVLAHEITHTSERHLEKELRKKKLGAMGIEEGSKQIPVEQLADLADRIGNILLAGKLSRNSENDADAKGLGLVAEAGYDTTAFPEFLSWLDQATREMRNKRALGVLTASHPSFSSRFKTLKKLVKKKKWDKEDRPRLLERYQANVVFTETPAAAEKDG